MARLRYSFFLPVVGAGLVGGFIGWTVTAVGCADTSCSPIMGPVIALASGLVAAAGVGVVVVLADRSLREWRDNQQARKLDAETPSARPDDHRPTEP